MAVVVAGAPAAALACGGFFMGSADLSPVSQSSERVLVIMHGDGTLTAVLEHSYAGAPEDFAWVVPVPGTPALSIVPPSTLRLIDAATRPVVVGPQARCAAQPGGCGCGLGADAARSGGDANSRDVDVEVLPQVGPYAPEVVSSSSATALSDWLAAHGYVVTPEMEPYIAAYVDAGASFLAVRLSPGADVRDIAPLAMTFAATTPVVPLSFAATVAEPSMGVAVIIVADTAFRPQNWQTLRLERDDVRVDLLSGQVNYDALVAWRVEQAGGEAFVLESVLPTLELREQLQYVYLEAADLTEARGYLESVLSGPLVVTRLFTRIAPWAVQSDPAFAPSADGPLAREIALYDQPPQELCDLRASLRQRTPCLETFCGGGGACAATELGDGCVCPAGYVARRIGADEHQGVACAPDNFDFLGSQPGLADPCAGACGEHGQCLALNGFPSCACAEGFAAALDAAGALRCVEVVRTYPPTQLLARIGATPDEDEGCAATPLPGLAPGLVLLGVVAAWRVVRRRAAGLS